MNTAHTPGPWTIQDTQINSCIIVLDSGPEVPCFVAMVPDNRINSVSHQAANARLIAAAPQLLETLKAATWLLLKYRPIGSEDEEVNKTLSSAHAIIAQATATV